MKIIQVSDDFWNVRGSFKIGGVVDIGTHASLVKCASGKFVFLDSLTLDDEAGAQIAALTNGGKDIDAVLNLHPFHTVHVQAMQQSFPDARHYGTQRHLDRFPNLRWESLKTEDPELHEQFAADFEFSVPRGVDFISSNPNLHFSSVLALHRRSRTVHVDDTIMYTRLPAPLRLVGAADTLSFHLTLSRVLEKRAGAVNDFRGWARGLISDWADAENLCAAHTAALLGAGSGSVMARVERALKKVEKTLVRHERKHG